MHQPDAALAGASLYLGGFNDKAIERTTKFGDGYFGNVEFVDLYIEKLRA